MPGEAVQIVSFAKKEAKATLDDAKLQQIIDSRREIHDMPTIVIAIGGVARSGKSFLLNLFVNYLSYLEQNGNDRGWEKSNGRVEGVNWAQSRTAITLGIWMWSEPFVITKEDGNKVVVLLVDSQGTGDNRRSDVKLDTLIMYISLQISSVQVLNIEKYLTSNEMISLQLCADYADIGGVGDQGVSGEDDYLFHSLMFVIRDYQSGDNFGEDPGLFREIVNEVDNDDLRKVVLGIQRAFRTINTYNMPHPGRQIASASAGSRNWEVKDIPIEFLVTTKRLIRRLCHLDWSREEQKCWPSAVELVANFKMLKYHLENDDLPQITNPADALQETILYRAYTVTQKHFQERVAKMSDPEKLKACPSEQELKKAFEVETTNAWERFKKAGKFHKYSRSAIWRKYQDMLNSTFETAYDGLKIQFEFHKQIRKLEADNAVVRQQIEEQANQFQQQIGSLNQTINETKQQQAESEDLFKAKNESLLVEIERLQQEVEDAQNDEEKEKLRQLIAQHQEETEKMRKENEESVKEHNRKMEALTEKMSEMQSSYQKGIQEQNNATEKMLAELNEERERRRKLEEEHEKKSKFDPLTAFIKTVSGAVLGAFAGGPKGALLGAMASNLDGMSGGEKGALITAVGNLDDKPKETQTETKTKTVAPTGKS